MGREPDAFAVGKMGKAQSWGRGKLDEGGRCGSGEVALLGGNRYGDLRPLTEKGEELRGLLDMLPGVG